MRRTGFLLASVLLALPSTPVAAKAPAHTAAHPAAAAPITIGVLAINDFHGNLEQPHQSVLAPDGKGGTAQVPAGGAAWLASALDALRAQYKNTLTVSAGDLIGGSAVTSALFLDEPTVEFANRVGIEFNALGNHEFDYGPEELKRKQTGGCAQLTRRKPCGSNRSAARSSRSSPRTR